MKRRSFLHSTGAVVGGSALWAIAPAAATAAPPPGAVEHCRAPAYPQHAEDPGFRGQRTLLFLDYFPLAYHENLEIKQAVAEYVPDGYYIDQAVKPGYDLVTSVPYFDAKAGLWKRFSGRTDVYLHESEDAIHWRPSPVRDAKFQQKHPHHLFTSKDGALSSIVHDPTPGDTWPFKALTLASGGPQTSVAFFQGRKRGEARHIPHSRYGMAVSADGVHWDHRADFDWGCQPMLTEEHYSLFYNHHLAEYVAAHRIRWGDRRIFFSVSKDLQHWSPPRQAFHPDVLDEGRVEFHGEAICRYDSYYIGLLWYGNYSNSNSDRKLHTGPGADTCHLSHSYDGQHFIRGHRQPLIPLYQSGQPWFAGLWTRGLLARDKDILLFTDTWGRTSDNPAQDLAADYADKAGFQAHVEKFRGERATVVHRLRKDGFTWLQPLGSGGSLGIARTHYLTLFDGQFTINADAAQGEIQYEVLGENIPPGYEMENCIPFKYSDDQAFQLRFKGKQDLSELVGKWVMIRFQIHRARLFALRGDFSTDPAHRFRIQAGDPMLYNTSWLY